MIVEIDGVEYKCDWVPSGFTYAEPRIKVRGTYLGIPCWRKWGRYSVTAKEGPWSWVKAMSMYPSEMRATFTRIIMAQHAFNRAWKEEEGP